MEEKIKFICRKRTAATYNDTTWINVDRMPFYTSSLISLYAYSECLYQPGYRLKKSLMAYWAVEYICEGKYVIESPNGKNQVEAGEILIHYPGTFYRRFNAGNIPVKKKVIMLNNSPFVSLLCNHSELNGREVVHCSNPIAAEAFFDIIRESLSAPVQESNFKQKMTNTIFELFTELIMQCSTKKSALFFDEQLEQLNVFSKDLTLDQMAQHFKTSKRSLNRVFQRQLNLSPYQYVIAMRMRYATQLLHSNALSIGEVAEECGYKKAGFFIEEFKKYFQQTPLQFREKIGIFNNRKLHLLDGWNRKKKNKPEK